MKRTNPRIFCWNCRKNRSMELQVPGVWSCLLCGTEHTLEYPTEPYPKPWLSRILPIFNKKK